MEKINELTNLRIGDKVYAPLLDRYFLILTYSYNNTYNEMYANLTPSIENPSENGFQATLVTMIELDYWRVTQR